MTIQFAATEAESWFVLVSKNGQTIMTSETYSTRSNGRRAARNTAKALGLELMDLTI